MDGKQIQLPNDSCPKICAVVPFESDDEAQQGIVCDDNGDTRRCKRKKANLDELYGTDRRRVSAMIKAKKVVADKTPSFMKSLVKSNIASWMHLSIPFCKLHLPKYDIEFTLEDEKGREYLMQYNAGRFALSTGWKKFSDAHDLVQDDVLVFHLVAPAKFKVYIFRASVANEADEDFTFNSHVKRLNCAPLQIKTYIKTRKRTKRTRPPPKDPSLDDTQNNSLVPVDTTTTPYSFNDIGSIDDFTILVDGFCIDSDISDHHKTKYYELCCSQNSLLHENLLKSINYKLSAEIIVQTVNISDAIRCSDITTSKADFELWDKTLKGFEVLGMNAGFIRSHLTRLITLLGDSEEPGESEKHRELVVRQTQVKEIIRKLELELSELKKEDGKLDVEIETVRTNIQNYRSKFQEEVNAPWNCLKQKTEVTKVWIGSGVRTRKGRSHCKGRRHLPFPLPA